MFFIATLAGLALNGCNSNAKESVDLLKQSKYWIHWHGAQSNYATPANIWRGFLFEEGILVANDANATIAFYLKDPASREYMHIVYNNVATKRIQVLVNEHPVVDLPFSPKFSRFSFSCTQLRKGFNQIRFQAANKNFRLRAVYLQNNGARFSGRDQHELKEGEGFEVLLLPGRIDFTFQGKASLQARSFRIINDSALSAPHSQTIAVAGKKTAFSFSSAEPFVVNVRCLQGSTDVFQLGYRAGKIQIKESALSNVPLPVDRKKIKDIFIFLLDGCQAGHLKLYGYHRDTAPRITEFAGDSLVFKQAFSNASYTAAAVGSIFTGLYPDHHEILNIVRILDKKVLTLPQFLKKTGYATSVFTANSNVSNRSGFTRDVDHYKQFLQEYRFNQSHKMVEAFGDWIQATPGRSFAYLHFMEPHFPIVPPPPFLNQYKKIIRPKKDLVIRRITEHDRSYSPEEIQDVIDDYDSCINYADALFGQAIDTLKKNNRYNDSLIILLSDHGEACYEHRAWGHGHHVYAEITRVPLVIKFPASCRLKGEIGSLVQTGALFPTLYKILTEKDGPFDFSSFSSILAGQPLDPEEMVVTQGFEHLNLYAIAWKQWYYINDLNRNWENLYNLADKPQQSRIQTHPDLASFLRLRFLGWLRLVQTKDKIAASADIKSLSKEEIEHLKAFGYL